MFDLVADVQSYPLFLPWCADAQIREDTPAHRVAAILIDFRGVRQTFATRNVQRRPEQIQMNLVEGPFQALAGQWTFQPLGNLGSKVELRLDYRLAGGALGQLLTPVFAQISSTLVDAFVRRAEQIHG